ncbi:beclin-1-like protein [Symsagittifera roscoffensis]|uniref:beclin-1-like protein n=1 Tax=Symsagittifera roscoffensis TaxID=84072 RepID=UPI00307BF250
MTKISNERLQLVCQYCYSPVVMGRPSVLDAGEKMKSHASIAGSPSKMSKSPSGSSLSLRRGDSKRNLRALSPSSAASIRQERTEHVSNVGVVDEFSQRSPEEAFESFQKVLHELEKENEAKGNPKLRVTSINPLTLIPLNEEDEEEGGKKEGTTDDDGETVISEDQSNSNGATNEKDHVNANNKSLPEAEQQKLNERIADAPLDSNLLPYSKETVDAVFDSLSECSALDFPLCCSCADTLIDNLDVKGQLLTRECRALMEQKVEEEQRLSQVCPESDLDQIIAQLESEEAVLLGELTELESEKRGLEETSRQLDSEEKKMLHEEAELSIENNELEQEIYELETSLRSVTEQLKFSEDHFNDLKKTNVFNLVFNIWHHDHKFGTINGFRLGKLNNDTQAGGGASSGRVEWSEINMALGQSCLLLHCLITKLNFQPNIYTLVPCGARSYIEAVHPSGANGGGAVVRERFALYSEGGNKFFYDSSIDSGMKAFLNVLDQFRATLEQKNSEFRLPYPMRGEIIYEKQGSENGYSVCPGKTSSEMWTKACRMMLTNLKWGIVGVCTISPHPSDWLQPQGQPGMDVPSRGRGSAGSSHKPPMSQNLYVNPNNGGRSNMGARNGQRN